MIQRIKNNTFARNSLILFTGSMAVNILSYVFHLVLGRIVSTGVYGEFESLNSLYMIISVPAVALVMIATKFSAHAKAENDAGKTYQLMSFLNKKAFKYIFPFFALAMLLTPLVAKFLNTENNFSIILLWVVMAISFVGAVNIGILNGWQKFKSNSLASVLGAVVKLILVIIFIRLGFALNGIMGSFVLGTLVAYLATFYALRFIIEKRHNLKDKFLEKIDIRSMRSYILPVFFGNLSLAIFGNADMVIAKHNLDPVSAGQYGALTIVSKIIFFGTSVIATVLFSMAAESKHKKSDTTKLLFYAITLSLFACAVGITAYFLFPNFILELLFRNLYLSVSNYMGWFAILVSLYSFLNLISQYLLSLHQIKFVKYNFLISVGGILIVLFTGKSFFAILESMMAVQIIAIFVGLYYLFQTYGRKIDLDNRADIQ